MSSFAVQNTTVKESTNNTLSVIGKNNVEYILTPNQTINPNVLTTSFTNTGSAYSATLPPPSYPGQIKYIMIGSSTSGTNETITINYSYTPNNTPGTLTMNGIGWMTQLFGTTGGWSEW